MTHFDVESFTLYRTIPGEKKKLFHSRPKLISMNHNHVQDGISQAMWLTMIL